MNNFVIEQPVRLDKWLWAARFFKTRSLATDAVNGGKVHINHQRCKAARHVKIDDVITITIGQIEREVIVRQYSEQRGPAKIAVTLYEETEASLSKREQQRQQRRLVAAITPVHGYRPSRKDRKDAARMRGKY